MAYSSFSQSWHRSTFWHHSDKGIALLGNLPIELTSPKRIKSTNNLEAHLTKLEDTLMRTKDKNGLSQLDQIIIEALSNDHPKSVNQLIKLVQLKNDMPKHDIMDRILLLQEKGKIVLKDQLPLSFTLRDFIFSVHAYWYLLIIALAATTATLVLANLERAPIIGGILIYVRYLFGSVFVLFLPGYSLIKALFPVKEVDNVERYALSIGMSLTLVAINALILNYTPWGISTTPITISLLGLTLALSTIAIVREHQALSRNDGSV